MERSQFRLWLLLFFFAQFLVKRYENMEEIRRKQNNLLTSIGFDAERVKVIKILILQGFSMILSNRTAAERVLKCDFCIKFGTRPFKEYSIMVTMS